MPSPNKAPIRWSTLLPLSLLGLILLFAFAACAPSRGVLAPASPDATSIANLFWGTFAVAAVIFVVTEALLIIALVRFRGRPGRAEPTQVHGNTRLEVGWTIAPAIILAGVLVATLSTMNVVAQPQPNAMRIRVVGHQWWWEAQYPDQGFTTATDIHIPVGQPAEVELASVDVIHSFWASELAGKMDVIPGKNNRLRLAADRPGTYRGQCAEYCGAQHANMGFYVIAEPRDQFDAWVQRTQAPPATPSTDQEMRGQQALLGGICVGCHTIEGTKAQGKVGPNLTHFASRRSIAGLTIENTPDNLKAWLTNNQAIKPGNKMPANLGLTPEQVQDIAAYLESLK